MGNFVGQVNYFFNLVFFFSKFIYSILFYLSLIFFDLCFCFLLSSLNKIELEINLGLIFFLLVLNLIYVIDLTNY